jgi:hypothetical protein
MLTFAECFTTVCKCQPQNELDAQASAYDTVTKPETVPTATHNRCIRLRVELVPGRRTIDSNLPTHQNWDGANGFGIETLLVKGGIQP